MLNVNEVTRLYLGIQGENLARPLVIDVKPWLMLYPESSVSIWHKRNGDLVPAPTGAVFDDEAGTVTWTPTSTDTYVDGEGEAEIRLTVGTVIKKSRSIITGVSPAVTGAGVPLGSDWQSYIDEVERIKGLAVTAKQGAEAAEAAAEAAQEAAEAAKDAAEEVLESIPEDYTQLSTEVTSMKNEMMLQEECIPGTTQTIVFDSSGNVQTITHSANGSAIRTDTFTFGTNTITEVRVLSTGEALTIITNTDTLITTVTYTAA